MRKVFRHLSYRVRVSIIMALFAIIPLSFFGGFYIKSERPKWEATALGEYSQMLAISSKNLDSEIQDMELKMIYVSNLISVRNAISKIDSMTIGEGLDYVHTLGETAAAITADNNHLKIRWYPYKSQRNYGSYSFTLDSFVYEFTEEEQLLDRILNLDNGEHLLVAREINRNGSNGGVEKHICLYTRMENLNDRDCLIEMSIPLETMISLSNSEFPKGAIVGMQLGIDTDNQAFLISSETGDEKEVLNEFFHTGGCSGYYPIDYPVDETSGSRIVCLFPSEYVLWKMCDDILRFTIILVFFIISVVACSYMASTLLTNKITLFLEKTNNKLDTILLDASSEFTGDSDFLGIEKRIHKLIQSTQEHYLKVEQYEIEKNRLELELLQMRFNPHFLYNTLTSIRYQVKDQHIRKSIDSLIRYYRIVLSKGHLMIKIEEELEMISEYLKLQVFAFELNNISYRFEVDENVKKYLIIKHLLQPIVENALEHGLRAKDSDGVIFIRAKLVDNDIVFEIEDNGAGMTEEKIFEVLSEPPVGSLGGGYGIYNVQQRIETYYGKDYGIVFHSKLGEGTCATIRIQQRLEEN